MSDAHCPEATLAGLVTGRMVPPPAPEFLEAALAAARGHGLGALVHERLRTTCWQDLPESVRQRWWRAASAEAAAALWRDLHLRETLDRLAEAGVQPLIIKGAALAQTHYPSPGLRPRVDSDLWIADADRITLDRTLLGAGYEAPLSIDGDLIMHQTSYVRRSGDFGFALVYDVHWRISNGAAVVHSKAFDYALCASRAVEIKALGHHARTLADEHALLLACVHLVGHHAHEQRLIWLYDVHLLVEAMDGSCFRGFATMAEESGFAAVCKDAIRRSAGYFDTLSADAAAWCEEPESVREAAIPSIRLGYTTASEVLWSDLRALPSWSQRFGYVVQTAWPSATYMKRRYGIDRRWKLPFYYLKRLVRALAKLVRRPGAALPTAAAAAERGGRRRRR